MGKAKSVLVEEFTSPVAVSVDFNASVAEVKELMDSQGFRHIPVLENGRPVGIISDRDIKLVTGFTDFTDLCASQIMSPEPFTVSSSMPIEEVALEMSKNKYGSAIVVDNEGGVNGIFTSTDALNALVEIVRGDI